MSPKVPTDSELLKLAEDAFNEAWEILNDEEGWKDEKKNDHGDVVKLKKNKKGRKIYRIKAIIPVPPIKLINALKDTDKLTEWNNTLTKHEVLKVVNDKVKISYQVTTEAGPGGIVSARDFIFLFKTDYVGDAFVQGGCSVEYPGPKDSKIVRAWNGPGAQVVKPVPGDPGKCEFIWLMDCEYKGWIPNSILDVAMPMAQIQFVDCVRKLAEKL